MVVRRQRICTTLDFNGRPWKLIVTRDFVLSLLVRRSISDNEFFDFIAREQGIIALLAKRKIIRMGLQGDSVLIDHYDLPA